MNISRTMIAALSYAVHRKNGEAVYAASDRTLAALRKRGLIENEFPGLVTEAGLEVLRKAETAELIRTAE
jgi:hypothetical protein